METEDLSNSLLEQYRTASVPSIWSALQDLHGYHQSFMQGVSNQTEGQQLVGLSLIHI